MAFFIAFFILSVSKVAILPFSLFYLKNSLWQAQRALKAVPGAVQHLGVGYSGYQKGF